MLDRKYEQKLDGKKKRQFELEKLRQMSFKEKIEYLWMYYKIYLLVLLVIIVGIYVGVQMYHGMKEEVLLNVVIMNGKTVEGTDFEKDVKKAVGVDKKNESVKFNTTITGTGEEYTSKVALTTFIGAESVDVLICPENVYREYKAQDGFVNLEKLLSKEALESGKVQKDAVVLEKNAYLDETIGVPYEPIYVCVLKNTKNHEESAARFIEMILKNI
nr:hypothetical protein [uncultured Sellimonas sp.]